MSMPDEGPERTSLDALDRWLQQVPYAAFLGINAELRESDVIFTLPSNRKFIGNPSLPAIHGGVIGGFMEQAAALHLIANMANPALPKIINFSLDYLRPALLHDTYAHCVLSRKGRFISNVTITAWQEDSGQPNAIARAHFLTSENN